MRAKGTLGNADTLLHFAPDSPLLGNPSTAAEPGQVRGRRETTHSNGAPMAADYRPN